MTGVSNDAMLRLRDIGLDEQVGDRFEIVREVGRGGSGRVFEAIDGETGARVALKILHSQRMADLARFNLEASILEEISHPAVVRYLAHGVTAADEHFIATEWLEGETLATRLAREGRLGVVDAVVLARDLARALAVVHARGVVHRDLKPSNVFLVGGRLDDSRLLDFGLARRPDQKLTRPGEVMGTVGFMSPEQARAHPTIDGRADLFSLGCLLYVALTGRPAFSGDDAMGILAKVMLTTPMSPRALRPSIPVEIEALVMRLLAKEPHERPPGGLATAEALEAWLRDPVIAPTPMTTAVMPAASQPPLAAPPSRTRSIAFIALGVAFVALGISVVAAYGSLRGRDEDASPRNATAASQGPATGERKISQPITVTPSETIEIAPTPDDSADTPPPRTPRAPSSGGERSAPYPSGPLPGFVIPTVIPPEPRPVPPPVTVIKPRWDGQAPGPDVHFSERF